MPFYIAAFRGDIFAALKFCVLRTCNTAVILPVIVITVMDAEYLRPLFSRLLTCPRKSRK